MDEAESSDGFSEWEQIQSPTDSAPPRTDMIAIEDNNFQHQELLHDLSVFPPSHHEGLEVTSKEEVVEEEPQQQEDEEEEVHIQAEEGNSSVQDSWSCTGDEANSRPLPLKKANEIGKILTSGIIKVAARVRNYVAFGCGVWSVGAVSGVVAAVLLSLVYAKVRRWRTRSGVNEEKKDRLMLLIREKDQKINQLMFQIAQMNELLSARRRVPVLRVS